MIKKILLLVAIFFVSTTSSYAGYDGRIMAITSLYTQLGYIKSPQLIESIAGMRSFSYFDSSGNEINKFIIEGRSQITKFDDKGSSVEGIFRYGENYISQYNYPNYYKDDEVALYRLSNNTIYEYDNKPDKKKGILGALGFYEDGPGNLVSYYKISPNGLISQFDNLDNLVSTLKITDNKTFSQYDTNGKKIAFYKILNNDETFPKKESTPVDKANVSTELNSLSIVPTLLLLAKEERLSNDNWNIKLKDIDSVSFYYNNTQKGRLISTSGGIYIYNNNGTKIGYLTATNSGLYFYNEQDKKCLYFSPTSNNIYIYDSYGSKIGELSFFGNNIYLYDTNNKVGEFSIVGGNIYQYNAQGKKIGEYILL